MGKYLSQQFWEEQIPKIATQNPWGGVLRIRKQAFHESARLLGWEQYGFGYRVRVEGKPYWLKWAGSGTLLIQKMTR